MRALVLALACAAATAGCTVLTSFDQPVEQGAQCGDGVDNDGNGLMDCQEASCADACERCGDGHPDDGEQCDDGNQDDTDGCLTGCVLARCGDGHVQAGVETCDDGNGDNGDACPDGVGGTCVDAFCGDSFVELGVEECDDGNGEPGDGCEPGTCVATCGGGIAADGRAYDPSTGHCYLGFAETLDVITANDVCMELGGYLAVPDDVGEDTLIRAAAPASASLGLADGDLDGGYGFRLVTGDLPASYLNFSSGQPDEPLDALICVSYDGDLPTWQDNDCATGRPYVCELEPQPCGDLVVQPGEECDDGNAADGDGCDASCADEDECALGTDNCDLHATCFNQPWAPQQPGFTCECDSGYVGDGVTCTPSVVAFTPLPPATISGGMTDCTTAFGQAGHKLEVAPGGVLYALMLCGGGDVYVTESGDAGQSWSSPTVLASGADEATVVGVQPGRTVVAMALTTGEVAVRQTLDGGATWEPAQTVTTDVAGGSGVAAAVSGGEVLIGVTSTAGTLVVHRATAADLSSFASVDTVTSVFGKLLIDPQAPGNVWAVADTPDFQLALSTDDGASFGVAHAPTSGGQAYSDWALRGGGRIYVTGDAPEVDIIQVTTPDVATAVTGLANAAPQSRTITADGAGHAIVAQAGLSGGVDVIRLPAGASVFDVPVTVEAVGDYPSIVSLPGGGLVAVSYTVAGEIRFAIVDPATSPPAALGLIHRWSFETGFADDAYGFADGTLFNGAAIVGGRLILDGVDDYLRTSPIDATIGARTLVAWVAVDNLAQRGGGVLTLEDPTPANDIFDAIVYGEGFAGEWFVGSDFGQRSNSAPVGVAETATTPTLVMLAYAYQPDGTITTYRDGVVYKAAFAPGPMQTYGAGVADVLIGVRHDDAILSTGTPTGTDPYLAGQVEDARIYDHALSLAEIQALVSAGPNGL
ncbi:MAG: hypothetical protein H6708_34405 [Kofleriaceae bacterium]|nr:hypothetical protein [Myxococcales bacterium]MCB9565507.1 hypothetical protein [Kofleriaceae bacterium]